MDTQTRECKHKRLKLLLAGQLSKVEHVATTHYLEACRTCQRELERIAGGAQWWNEASDFLRPSGDDLGELARGAVTSEQLLSTDELGPVEFTFDFLDSSTTCRHECSRCVAGRALPRRSAALQVAWKRDQVHRWTWRGLLPQPNK